MASKRKPVCVIVAGMHRSGTSALTRVLSLLGCALPSTLLAANFTNETGHWEPQRIQEFNDRLLASAGCAWDDWTPVPQDWFDSLEANARKEEAAELFKAEYGSAPLTVFKDPRVCRLLPFWLSVLDDLGIEPVVAIPVRHPLEVARSLAIRDLSDAHYNRLLWLRHVADAERYTRDRRRYFCSYDDLLESWSAVVSRMGDALGVKWPRMSAQAVEEIDAFLKPQLRHHSLNPRLLDDDRTEPEWLRTTYAVAARWASEGEDAEGKAQLDRISSAMDEAGASFGILALRGKAAMTRVREIEAELAHTRLERDELSSRFEALAIVLGDSRQEVAGLQGQNATSQSLADHVSNALAEANARAEAARSEVDAVRSEADALVLELQEAKARAEEARSETDAMETALKNAGTRSDAARVEADALIAALDEANARADAACVEVETLNSALQEASAGGDAARSEMESLTEALTEANTRGAAARAEVEVLLVELETATVRASAARSEADALIAALDEANKSADAAQADAAEARSEAARDADALASANELSAQALSRAEETLKLREAELAQLAAELSLGRDTLASAMKDMESDRTTSGDLHGQIAGLVSKLREAEVELGDRTKAIASMQLALDVSDERRGELEIEKDQSEQMVRALKSNIDLLLEDAEERDQIRKQLGAAEEELSVLTERLASMEADLAQSTSALRQRSAEADDAYGELERVRDLLHTETNDKARLERAAEGLKANISLLMSDLSERDGEVARIRSEAEQFRTTIQAGQKRLNELFVESQITVENLVRGITLEPTPLFQSRRTSMRKKAQLIREAGVVDPDWYRSAYPDIQESGLDPVEHFIAKGYLEGRRPKR